MISWNEFYTYFIDYQEIEERNKKLTKDNLGKNAKGKPKVFDPEEEVRTLLETEKQRRLLELPKLRPADQIDISEERLQLIKDIYENLKKKPTDTDTKVRDEVPCTSFFLAVRKHPQMKAISTALARDPEGTVRLGRETFKEVFDRMENENHMKAIEWCTIVEYFTKRGKPLTKEEIKKLQEEDKRIQEEQLEIKRLAEERLKKGPLAVEKQPEIDVGHGL